jgi:hypothetical protein
MEHVDARRFVDDWIRNWNAHDVDGVLEHFADDAVFTSPVAARVLADGDGVVRGKEALRAYWTTALSQVPDLHFDLVGRYVGVHTIVINFRNQKGVLCNEVLVFEGSSVVQGHGTYLDE